MLPFFVYFVHFTKEHKRVILLYNEREGSLKGVNDMALIYKTDILALLKAKGLVGKKILDSFQENNKAPPEGLRSP